MVECVFTLDYEIYGNGQGSLRELVLNPANELTRVFDAVGARLVVFVEAAELEVLEEAGCDPAIEAVKVQIRLFHRQGHEIALHLHPQWYNARRLNGCWQLDYSEYNLCTLAEERIEWMVTRAIDYLRRAVGDLAFVPFSFRAGNWLFQPTATAARVLSRHGVKTDSSVFKGGVQHRHRLDYRPAARNGWHWRFSDDVNRLDPTGRMIEVPIYAEMVPFWRMLTGKRVRLQQKTRAARPQAATGKEPPRRRFSVRDYLRPWYPLKFDFCRMTFREMTSMVERVLGLDAASPDVLKPLVAIGHTKDLVDLDTVEHFLNWLAERSIPISTFKALSPRF